MINKRGNTSDFLRENFIYLFLVVILVVGLLVIGNHYRNGAFVWEDFYAKEIAKTIDYAQAGDEVSFDVTKAIDIAKRNNVNFDEIFSFEDEVCVRLSNAGRSCFEYFENFKVINKGIEYDIRDDKGNSKNILTYVIKEKNEI